MSSFVPLTTYQGLRLHELKDLINSRDIYIWGCGHLGRSMKRSFKKNGFEIKAFCDSNPLLQKKPFDDTDVIAPGDALDLAKRKLGFILIASAVYKDEMEISCINAGLIKKEDYLSYIHISRPEAAIDVAGTCNLRCSSCPRGNMEHLRPEGYMSLSVFKRVLDKLTSEMPFLINIELSTWGEPFMNPDLASIIQTTELTVPCTVHTNLQLADNMENVVRAQPSQLIVSAGGYEKSYEHNHAGASWSVFLNNLKHLKMLFDKYRPRTQINVLYHMYRDNQSYDFDNMRRLCRGLGLKLHTTWAYLNPYDKMLNYCEGRDIGSHGRTVMGKLAWNVNRCLELSKADLNRPCLCQRIFPIINWDLSVSLCHIYYNPVITDNFLDIGLNKIIGLRHNQSQCKSCQKHGLHRLDIEVLLKRYPDESIMINDTERIFGKC